MNSEHANIRMKLGLAGVLAATTLFIWAASAQQAGAKAAQKVTITGTVSGSPQGQRFTIRTASGRSYQVDTQGSAATLPISGQRVNAFGVWRNGVFQAANVRQIGTPSGVPAAMTASNAAKTSGQLRTVGGVLTEYPVNKRFALRAEEGRLYQVHSLAALPVGLSVGDRVRAYGTWNNGVLTARSLRLMAEGGPEELRNANRTVVGVVVSDDLGADFQVRTDSGSIYRVQEVNTSTEPYHVGDRISAIGTWRNGTLQAEAIRVLSND